MSDAEIEYLVVDDRLSTSPPIVGRYFETGEPNDRAHRTPLDLEAIRKFDRDSWFDRTFDSGNIKIYRVVPRQ